jgi:RHS repeat-associated protein
LYVAQDANYNVTAVFGISGNVQERFTYDPYGTRTIYSPAYVVRTSSSWGWVFGHQGLRQDQATGKYHARNRDYDPAEGRWMTEDPIGFNAGDMNLYRALGNSPLNYLDPAALDKKSDAIELLGQLSEVGDLKGGGILTNGQDAQSIKDRAASLINTRLHAIETGKLWVLTFTQTVQAVSKIGPDLTEKVVEQFKDAAKDKVKEVVKDRVRKYLVGDEIEHYIFVYKSKTDVNEIKLSLVWNRETGKFAGVIEGKVAKDVKDRYRVKTEDCDTDDFLAVVLGTATRERRAFGGEKVQSRDEKVTWVKPKD